MGNSCCGEGVNTRQTEHVVRVHIYKLASSNTNALLSAAGVGGAWHTGVQIGPMEYAFSGFEGVYSKQPCVVYSSDRNMEFSETLDYGTVLISRIQLNQLVGELQRTWPAEAYDLLRNNCNHFTNCVLQRLGVGELPQWVNSLATKGASVAGAITSMFKKDKAQGGSQSTGSYGGASQPSNYHNQKPPQQYGYGVQPQQAPQQGGYYNGVNSAGGGYGSYVQAAPRGSAPAEYRGYSNTRPTYHATF